MSGDSRWLPPRHVPTLTEVVDSPGADVGPQVQTQTDDAAPAPNPADASDVREEAPSAEPSEQQLVERVLADVQRQVGLMLEQRLREMLAPALARWSEALVEDSRQQIAVVLRDVIEQAVTREFERQRRR